MSLPRSLPAVLAAAVGRTLARPRAVVALLALNLAFAVAVAAPLAGLLSAELDHDLYGDAMARGASWRWFDTADRRHPLLIGNLDAWGGLLGDEGVTATDLGELSGVPAAVALAGLALFWLNALVHTGFLASLRPASAGGAPGLLAGTGRHAAATTLLAAVAAAGYAAVYAAVYVYGGRALDEVGTASQREWVSMGLTWARLLTTLGLMLAVKLWFDLARAALVELGGRRLGAAAVTAVSELARRGPLYGVLYLALGLGTPLLAAGWWLVERAVGAPVGWWGLALLFALHQAVVAGRIGLRLAHLAASQALYVSRMGED